MSNFFEHSINLEGNQVKKLKALKAVTVKHPQIGSGLTIHLNELNHKRMMKAFKAKKNHRLKMTKDELDQNEKEGTGFFQSLHKIGASKKQFLSGAKKVAKVAAPLVASIAKPAGAMIGTALATATGNPELIPVAAPLGSAVASMGSSALTNYANGKGLVGDIKKEVVNPLKKAFKPVIGKGIAFVSNQPTQIHSNAVLGGHLNSNHTFNQGYYNTLPLSNPAMHPFVESGLRYVGGRGFQASGY